LREIVLHWYNAAMINLLADAAIVCAIVIIALMLGISIQGAAILGALFALCLSLWLGFRSALREARRRQRPPYPFFP
jgi:hypothetical protein